MRATLSAVIVFTLAFAGLFYGGVAIAAQGNAAHTHIGHVADGWRDTPDNQGLLPTAIAEAKIAAQHAALAAKDPSNLDAMKRHTGHVVNAVDPEAMANGPGLGYGVKRAAAGAATHIELAAKSDGASGGVTATHSNHIATSARNTVARADEIIALAGEDPDGQLGLRGGAARRRAQHARRAADHRRRCQRRRAHRLARGRGWPAAGRAAPEPVEKRRGATVGSPAASCGPAATQAAGPVHLSTASCRSRSC